MFDSRSLNDPKYDNIVTNIIKQEVIPYDFVYKGYDCKIMRSPLGSLCGYVSLDESHPFYGKDYSDTIDVPLSILNRTVDEYDNIGILSLLSDSLSGNIDKGCLSISSCFDVHGGITFSGRGSEMSDRWWFGFDCAHADDYVPACPMGGTYKEVSFVERHCRNLVDQLIAVSSWDQLL